MTTNKSALERGQEALKELIKTGQKVNKHAVAKKGDFNHSNLYKAEFRDIKDEIELVEEKQKQQVLADEVEALKRQVIDLKSRLKATELKLKNTGKGDSVETDYIMAKLHECYALNARLMAENTDLKNQLAHSMGDYIDNSKIDKTTGEIISGSFNRP